MNMKMIPTSVCCRCLGENTEAIRWEFQGVNSIIYLRLIFRSLTMPTQQRGDVAI